MPSTLTRRRIRAGLAHLIEHGFPWWAAGDDDLAARFRARARRAGLERWPAALRPLAVLAMAALWPAASLREAWRWTRWADGAALGTMPRRRILIGAWGAALRHSVHPSEYLAYRLWESRGVHRWALGDELAAFNHALISAEALRLADDKAAFARFCTEVGLPAPRTLAIFRDGAAIEPFAAGGPPATDLVVKPCRGASAEGVEGWFHRDGAYHAPPAEPPADGIRRLDAEGLARRIARLSHRPGGVMVQEMLRPHPALAVLAGAGVPTLRLVTGAGPDGPPVLLDAFFQAPREGCFVSQGYGFAPLALDSGRVQADTPGQRRPLYAGFALRPEFVGVAVPDWPACVALVNQAHAAFPRPVPFLGWDVALTDRGPVLVETNVAVSFYLTQAARLVPAFEGPLARIVERWLAWSA